MLTTRQVVTTVLWEASITLMLKKNPIPAPPLPSPPLFSSPLASYPSLSFPLLSFPFLSFPFLSFPFLPLLRLSGEAKSDLHLPAS